MRSKGVYQVSLDGQELNFFESCAAAGKAIEKGRQLISQCANGRDATAYGYIWRYEEDVAGMNQDERATIWDKASSTVSQRAEAIRKRGPYKKRSVSKDKEYAPLKPATCKICLQAKQGDEMSTAGGRRVNGVQHICKSCAYNNARFLSLVRSDDKTALQIALDEYALMIEIVHNGVTPTAIPKMIRGLLEKEGNNNE